MKLPPFVYTRRWLVIMGLTVTLACMIGVLVYLGYRSQDASADNNSTNTEESTSSATPASESTPSASSSETNEITLGSTASAELTASAKSTMGEVEAAMETKNGQKLYDLLSSEMKAIFTVESVTTAFAQADGLTISAIDEMKINSEWAKQDVESVDAAGQSMRFRVVLHLEDGKWKLYGTEKLS